MNQPSPARTRRLVFIIVSLTDTLLGGLVLLVYFGFLPVDLAALEIPRWAVGVFGALWFFSGLGILAYQLTRTVEEP